VTYFAAADDGRILGTFGPLEAELLGDLATQVIELLDAEHGIPEDRMFATFGIGGGDAPSDDPAVARLLPNAYPDDEHASREFRNLTESSLVARNVANARQLIESLEGGVVNLAPADQQAWLRSINDIRLIVASRLGVEREGDEWRADTDRDILMIDLYQWLSQVQASLLETMEAQSA
jgi:hypothetical protein